MGKKKRSITAQIPASETARRLPDWETLEPFNAAAARKWSEKFAGRVLHCEHRTFQVGGVYIESGRLYFWVAPCDSGLSYFRIDSKIARYLKHGYWEEV